MAFTPETFVLCSKTNLFKANASLWIYSTADTLEDCLEPDYFQPRRNIKNQDSPEVGDVIQLIVENSKIAYVKIVAKTEKPYNITVARTFLENEATLIAELAKKADKETDFVTPITNLNKGITQTEQEELAERIDLAINSGSMITQQGVWYAKMDAGTTPPSADEGATYADFSQTDQDSNPIIVIYTYTSGVWTQTSTVTPPASTDGYVAVTLKFWDIPQQSGQQGGRVLWNHTAKTFTPFPTIISYNDVTLTGDSTVVMPDTPSDGQIINLEYFKEHMRGAGRNVGDIFYTSRKDTEINGAVACDGSTYQTTDYMGSEAPGALLTANKLPYVSMADYAQLLTDNGSVGVFGWDGIGTTAFRVPTLTDIFLETGTLAQLGNYLAPGLPSVEHTHGYTIQDVNETTGENSGTGTGISFGNVDKTTSENSALSEIYGNSDTVQPNAIRYRAMVQLYTGVSDNAQIAVNDSTITITQGGVIKGSFTLNQLNNETIALDAELPSQTNQNGKFLTTNGTNPSWVALATVAKSGAYSDLSGTPTIPTVGNGTITIAQGGVSKGTFTVNQSGDTTINLDAGGGGTDLPDQTGHSGEFLTTNGTAASWDAAPVTSVNNKTGAVTLSASDVGALSSSTHIPADPVQADWSQVDSSALDYIKNKPTTLSGYGITDGANTDLSNLTSTGANIGNWSHNVSNCITEIPQNIKLELNNGTLTLKAGSKVYVPNGVGVFDEVTVASDVSITPGSTLTTSVYLLFYNGNDFDYYDVQGLSSNIVSGATDPMAGQPWHIWYDTTNNIIKVYRDSGSDVARTQGLPIAELDVSNGVGVVSIRKIFNGFGYIGSARFALPRIEWLSSNGINDDGTLKSIKRTNANVLVEMVSSGIANNIVMVLSTGSIWTSGKYIESETEPSGSYIVWYKPSENILRTKGEGNWNINNNIVVYGYYDMVSNKITSFRTKQPFHAVDYNDTEFIGHQAMPTKERRYSFTVGVSGSSYVAPADGYVFCFKVGLGGDGFIYIEASGIMAMQGFAVAGGDIRVSMPIKKGDSFVIVYNGNAPQGRFIYTAGSAE